MLNFANNQSLADRMDVTDSFNISFDLTRLFIFYFITPILRKIEPYETQFLSWIVFNEKLTILMRKVNTGQESDKVLKGYIRPIQDELNKFDIDLVAFHGVIKQRNSVTHRSIRSTNEQEEFIEYVVEHGFSTKFKCLDLVQAMLEQMKKVQLRRFVN